MPAHAKFAKVEDRIVMLGLGSIGQAVLPLLLRHLEVRPEQIEIFAADEIGRTIAEEFGVTLRVEPVNRGNYRRLLNLTSGCFLINLSVGVSSKALIQLCREQGALYLDTCILPWPDPNQDDLSATERSNYGLREDVFAMNKPGTPTAVVTMGANPGLASAFLKSALASMAEDNEVDIHKSDGHEDWARLARDLDIKTIHVAERDTQTSPQRRERGEFVNTWSVRGLITEGLQPAELGWGTHERHWPRDAGRHNYGGDAAIFLNRPGAGTRVRSWTPLEGAYHGFLITHAESISIAEYLTVTENDRVTYRPTVYYAYHPCDDAVLSLHEMAGKNWELPESVRIMRDEISSGTDELGILLMGNKKGVYWYGSRLSIEDARELVDYNSATSLQVAAGVLGGVVWALNNPRAGIVEPDDIAAADLLEVASPYLGEVVGVYGDWTPLEGRETLFGEDLDHSDPWQFKNFRVN
jgi:homospermidine synthase